MSIPPTLASFLCVSLVSANAAVVVADFNDNSPGPLGSFTAGAGQGGGSGWDGASVWGNTGTINVVGGDLAAPGSTNYAIAQTGTGQSIQGTFATGRHTTRAVATTLVGDIWFSFLLNQATINSRGGLSFNQDTSAPGDPRIVATGTDLRLGLATLQGSGAALTVGQTSLVVGRLSLSAVGAETLSVWVDPDVAGGIAGLGAPSTTLTEDAPALDAGVTRIGLQSYSSDNQGGILDSVRFSDDPDRNRAFADVTGILVPEPATGMLVGIGALLALGRRTRRG